MADGKLADLVTDHAVGTLEPGRGLLVATLAAIKPEVSKTVEGLEAAGAGLLSAAPAETLPAGGFDALMARLDAQPPEPPPGVAPAVCPEPLRAPIAAAAAKGRWRAVAAGIQCLDLKPALPGAQGLVELLCAEPGAKLPRHRHEGEEFVLVLQGGLRDESGRFGVGDIAIGDGSMAHEPVAESGEICVCLVVSDSAPAFTGLLGAAQKTWDWIKARF